MYQETVQDPVCGMTLTRAAAAASFTWQGHTYYFCCASCREAFDADSRRYVERPVRREEVS